MNGQQENAPVFGKWLPIESAPTDGTYILVCDCGFTPLVGNWQVMFGYGMFSPDMSGMFATDAELKEYWLNTGYEPTHWMPLPEPPSAGAFLPRSEAQPLEADSVVTTPKTIEGDTSSTKKKEEE